MYKNRKIIGIVPARGGSKGLPGKNIKPLCGYPLIYWTIQAGLEAKLLDEVMVSTDYENIAEIAKKYNASVPFIRPAHLAQDTTPSYDVVEHVLDYYKGHLNQSYDYVVLLEPTSPLREKDDIDRMIEKLVNQEDQFDSIVSIAEVYEHPSLMKKVSHGVLMPFCKDLPILSRRQENEPAYHPYGVAYIVKTTTLNNEKTFYTKRSMFHQLKRYQRYEIDDIYDFLAIENIMKFEWGLK